MEYIGIKEYVGSEFKASNSCSIPLGNTTVMLLFHQECGKFILDELAILDEQTINYLPLKYYVFKIYLEPSEYENMRSSCMKHASNAYKLIADVRHLNTEYLSEN